MPNSALSRALAQQHSADIQALMPAFLTQHSLSLAQFTAQQQRTEQILTRIFKTDKNLTPKFLDYLYFESQENVETVLQKAMEKHLLVSFLANENAKIYIKDSSNAAHFVELLQQRGAKKSQIFLINQSPKQIFLQILSQMREDFPNQTHFPITENRLSLITPSSEIKPRLALADALFNRVFSGVEIDDFSYLDQPRENLQHNNETIRYKTFQAMLDGLSQ